MCPSLSISMGTLGQGWGPASRRAGPRWWPSSSARAAVDVPPPNDVAAANCRLAAAGLATRTEDDEEADLGGPVRGRPVREQSFPRHTNKQ
jgi:hypothetical protein